MTRIETLTRDLAAVLGSRVASTTVACGEVTIVVPSGEYLGVARTLHDDERFGFEQCIDLAVVDYLDYGNGGWAGARFAVVLHLLSVAHNWRLRVRTFCPDDDLPMVASVTPIWSVANWLEREAFDLYGIMFTGHPDLRRLLTDYGFVGHPFRKDFPLSGNVEMRYDPEQKRVIYQPVTIEPRVITPRIVREENYADSEGFRKG